MLFSHKVNFLSTKNIVLQIRDWEKTVEEKTVKEGPGAVLVHSKKPILDRAAFDPFVFVIEFLYTGECFA
jgi:hypothetical protein